MIQQGVDVRNVKLLRYKRRKFLQVHAWQFRISAPVRGAIDARAKRIRCHRKTRARLDWKVLCRVREKLNRQRGGNVFEHFPAVGA